MVVDHYVLGDGRLQGLCHAFGGRWLHTVGNDHREFVAAEAREERIARGAAQQPANLAQQSVAHRMAEHVIDLLEAVEVDAQYGEAAA